MVVALVNQQCERLTSLMRLYDQHAGDRPSDDPATRSAQRAASFELAGRIWGLREGLCILLGFNPNTESGKEGLADQFVMNWWEEHHSEEEW